DGRNGPGIIRNSRRRGIANGLERPERRGWCPCRGGDRAACPSRAVSSSERALTAASLGPCRAPLDPLGQRSDLVVLELSLGGHVHSPLIADCLDERAKIGLARNHDRAGFASLEHCVSPVEPQPRLVLIQSVTFQAMRYQNGADLRLKELFLLRLERARGRLP